jgi:hypothetical protein
LHGPKYHDQHHDRADHNSYEIEHDPIPSGQSRTTDDRIITESVLNVAGCVALSALLALDDSAQGSCQGTATGRARTSLFHEAAATSMQRRPTRHIRFSSDGWRYAR